MTIFIATPLLEQLKLRQTAECLSGRQFAEKLGVSHQLWQKTRTGEIEIGLALLKATVKAYPVLNRDVLLFLAGPGEVIKPPENTGEGILGGLWFNVVLAYKRRFGGGLL